MQRQNLGLSINARVKGSMTLDLLQKLVFKELGKEEGANFFTEIQEGESATESHYGNKSKDVWEKSGVFTIPQPFLQRDAHTFGLHENEDATKRLSARFSKRLLMIPHVAQDLATADHSDPNALYPSLPFGFKCQLLNNVSI